jgi:hypothetical protein
MITAAALTFPRLQASVTSLSRQCDAPVRRTAVTCNDAIQVTIYSCRISTATNGNSGLPGTLSWIFMALTALVGVPLACAVAVLSTGCMRSTGSSAGPWPMPS